MEGIRPLTALRLITSFESRRVSLSNARKAYTRIAGDWTDGSIMIAWNIVNPENIREQRFSLLQRHTDNIHTFDRRLEGDPSVLSIAIFESVGPQQIEAPYESQLTLT